LCKRPISIGVLTDHLAEDGLPFGASIGLNFTSMKVRAIGSVAVSSAASSFDSSFTTKVRQPPSCIPRGSAKHPRQLLLAASGVERISAAAESNKCQRTADDRHILHEVLELIQIAKLRVPDES
jgi:hypothetical protein